jgi:hypothetical protein
LRAAWDQAFAEVSAATLMHYGKSPTNARAFAEELDRQKPAFEQSLPPAGDGRTKNP